MYLPIISWKAKILYYLSINSCLLSVDSRKRNIYIIKWDCKYETINCVVKYFSPIKKFKKIDHLFTLDVNITLELFNTGCYTLCRSQNFWSNFRAKCHRAGRVAWLAPSPTSAEGFANLSFSLTGIPIRKAFRARLERARLTLRGEGPPGPNPYPHICPPS